MHRPSLLANMQPQAWIRDNAVDVDGERDFDAADAMIGLPNDGFASVVEEVLESGGRDLDVLAEEAGLLGHGEGQHNGPFYVRLKDDEAGMLRFLQTLGWDGGKLDDAGIDAMKAAYAAMAPAPEDPEARVIGYQILDAQGNNVHGEDDDPFGMSSYDVLVGKAADAARAWVAENPGYSVGEVKADDVEEPTFLGRVEAKGAEPRA